VNWHFSDLCDAETRLCRLCNEIKLLEPLVLEHSNSLLDTLSAYDEAVSLFAVLLLMSFITILYLDEHNDKCFNYLGYDNIRKVRKCALVSILFHWIIPSRV